MVEAGAWPALAGLGLRMTRRANLGLLVFLAVAFVTGWVAFAYGTVPSRWALIVHAVSGFGLLVLVPWKSLIVSRSLRRRRRGRFASLVLAVVVLASLVAGLLHSLGLPWWGPFTAMELHVGAAIAAVPLVIWHVLARPVRLRPTDFARRNVLRYGGTLALAGAVYAASEAAVRMGGLPGARRRFTGSYEVGSFQPDLLPATSWLFDAVPTIDVSTWRLRVRWPGGEREWTYEELWAFDDRIQAILDCTGGFWSEQMWAGVRLDRLFPERRPGSSVHVISHTGYDRRLSVPALGQVLLATRLGGVALSPDHGYPARLVVPGSRGFWWVKWVRSVELQEVPAWWQLPFPVQ
jgi:hypothetical protein